jgi:hypothetical protein
VDTDLKLAAVAQITIMDAQSLVDELEQLRLAYAKQIGAMSQILKAFNDLYLEFTGKASDRKWLGIQIATAEREANRLRMPSWFWRIDSELPLDDQIYRRVRFLLREKPGIHLDDLWDALTDALTCSNVSIDSNDLQIMVEEALNASSS